MGVTICNHAHQKLFSVVTYLHSLLFIPLHYPQDAYPLPLFNDQHVIKLQPSFIPQSCDWHIIKLHNPVL
jgi:hypothetical protein